MMQTRDEKNREKAERARRRAICMTCPLVSKTLVRYCTDCMCPIVFKTISGPCPLNKW